ncbi:MAG TPA: DNA-processing protein DprA [Acidimicrobiales bacterium]|nr:DNA-processing protein DprA [Acidimicrobiales bacterium]
MTAPADELPPAAFALALAELPAMGPARLLALHRAFGPVEAWSRVGSGRVLDAPAVMAALRPRPGEVLTAWATAVRRADPAATWARHAGVAVATVDDPTYPAALVDDVEPPAVLVWHGELEALDGPRVAVVGTRRCTRTGREVAAELGRELAAAGIRVVSGLASGIDGAAHRGALAADGAPPVAVVGCGLDVPYPHRHAALWAEVAARGLVVSEAPLGTRPAPWRFPARNRIIAALADVVVVVESHAAGGSMHTVDEALRRDRTVLAVPGSVRNPAAAGTNRLLHEGMGPARDVSDVLIALGSAGPAPPGAAAPRSGRPTAATPAGATPAAATPAAATRPGSRRSVRPAPSPDASRALAAIGWDPVTIDAVARDSGLATGPLALALEELDAAGWVHRQGGYVERRSEH